MQIVAISADSAKDSATYAKNNGIRFPLLNDGASTVMSAYGVRMVDTPIAVPATFLVNTERVVVWSHIGATQRDFADIDALQAAIAGLPP